MGDIDIEVVKKHLAKLRDKEFLAKADNYAMADAAVDVGFFCHKMLGEVRALQTQLKEARESLTDREADLYLAINSRDSYLRALEEIEHMIQPTASRHLSAFPCGCKLCRVKRIIRQTTEADV